MTTVGYGDISGTNTGERIVCCILMIMGVLFFTYVSGTITNIITNNEEENKVYQEKKMHLDKLYKKHSKTMRPELYIELLQSIKFSSNNDMEEFNDFPWEKLYSMYQCNTEIDAKKTENDILAKPKRSRVLNIE